MCCLIASMMLFGPRVAIVLWWLFSSARWDAAFSSVFIPIAGFFLLPWTTLMWVLVAPNGNASGIDGLFLLLAVIVDLSSYGSGFYGSSNRNTPQTI